MGPPVIESQHDEAYDGASPTPLISQLFKASPTAVGSLHGYSSESGKARRDASVTHRPESGRPCRIRYLKWGRPRLGIRFPRARCGRPKGTGPRD